MMSVDTSTRRTPAARLAGYAVAAAVNAVLLYLINGRPGWEVVPFLTGDMERVVTWVNASLVVGVAVNLAYLVHPVPWLTASGGVVSTGVGLAALVRLWQVFPFDFGTGSGWTVLARVLILVGIAGSVAGILAQIASLIGAIRRRGSRAE
jgi:hypothetical protein